MTHDEIKDTLADVIYELECLKELDVVFEHIEAQLPTDIDEKWLTVMSWLLSNIRSSVDNHVNGCLAPTERVWRSLDGCPHAAAHARQP